MVALFSSAICLRVKDNALDEEGCGGQVACAREGLGCGVGGRVTRVIGRSTGCRVCWEGCRGRRCRGSKSVVEAVNKVTFRVNFFLTKLT